MKLFAFLSSGGSGGSDITVVTNYSALPAANTVSGQFYWCSNAQGTSWLPGSLGGTYYNSGLYYSNGTTWEFLNVPFQATQSEVDAGTVEDKFVTPKTFNNSSQLASKVPNTRTINGLDLTTNRIFTTADIEDSTNKRYVTNANLTKINAIDQAVSSAEKSTWNSKQDALGFTPVPNTRTVNGKALSTNITLNSSDIGSPSGSGTSSGTNTGDQTSGVVVVTSGTTLTTPSTVSPSTRWKITLIGGGGGGAGMNTANQSAAGGGSAGTAIVYLTGLTASTDYTCAIGQGGAGGASASNGSDGTDTTLTIGATTYTAEKGGGGATGLAALGGAGGGTTNATIAIRGQQGDNSPNGTSSAGISGAGGNTLLGLGGQAVNSNVNGRNATGYGAGGSGGKGTAVTGGNGANGIIIAEYWT